jgi:hypothetical protein
MIEDSIPDEFIQFFNLPKFFSSTVVLGSSQPLAEISTRNNPRAEGRLALKTDNLTDIYEPIF